MTTSGDDNEGLRDGLPLVAWLGLGAGFDRSEVVTVTVCTLSVSVDRGVNGALVIYVC